MADLHVGSVCGGKRRLTCLFPCNRNRTRIDLRCFHYFRNRVGGSAYLSCGRDAPSRFGEAVALRQGFTTLPDRLAQRIAPLRAMLFCGIRVSQGLEVDISRSAYQKGDDLLRLLFLDLIAPGDAAAVISCECPSAPGRSGRDARWSGLRQIRRAHDFHTMKCQDFRAQRTPSPRWRPSAECSVLCDDLGRRRMSHVHDE